MKKMLFCVLFLTGMLTAMSAEPIVKDLNLIASTTKEAVTITGNLDNLTVYMLRLTTTTYTTSESSKVTGTVTCDDCGPMSGVNVIVKGTQIGTTTNAAGYYEITCPSYSILEFSHLGHEKLAIERNGRSVINVEMWEP